MSNVKLKKLVSLILTAAMVLAFVPMNVFATDGTLTTTTIDGEVFYQIYDAADLKAFSTMIKEDPDSWRSSNAYNAILMNNIKLNDIEFDENGNVLNEEDLEAWTPIGGFSGYYPGTFDGNGYFIEGLYCKGEYSGLFHVVTGGGVVKNLAMDNAYIVCENAGAFGVIAQTLSNANGNGSILNCYIGSNIHFKVETATGKVYIGGLVGGIAPGIVANVCSYIDTTKINNINGNENVIVGSLFGRVANGYVFKTTYTFSPTEPQLGEGWLREGYYSSEDSILADNPDVTLCNGKVMPKIIAKRLLYAAVTWNGKDGSVQSEINITVNPITELDVDVPIVVTFVIDENRNITLPDDVKIISRSKTPLDVSLKASSNDINLVAANTFDDDEWDNLGQADTTSYFALKINSVAPPTLNKDLEGNVSFAADNETHEYEMLSTDVDAHDLGMLRFYDAAASEIGLGFAAKYGKAWGNSNNIEVAINLMFTLGTPE